MIPVKIKRTKKVVEKKKFGDPVTSLFHITVNTNISSSNIEGTSHRKLVERHLDYAVSDLVGGQEEIGIPTDVKKVVANQKKYITFLSPNFRNAKRLKEDEKDTEITAEAHTFDDNRIDGIELKYGFEVGKKFGKLHIHVAMKIEHRTRLQLNTKEIKKIFIDRLSAIGIKSVHVNIRGFNPSPGQTLEDYISKQLSTDE